jgi:CubicO group peptidase (beta-lactamase class C family)
VSERFAKAAALLDEAVAARVTPGGQISVRWRDGEAWRAWDHAFGNLSYEADHRTTVDTRYDLASVTKAFVALSLVRASWRGAVDLRAPLETYLDETRGRPVGAVTLEQLASHRGQLPAWKPFFESASFDLATVAATPLEPCDGVRYSDVGYILLGAAMTRALGTGLGAIVRDEVTRPLAIDDVVQYRGAGDAWRDANVAPTERCAWRGRVVRGEVHDENAFAMGGTSGHAGLFGTARAVVVVGRASLDALGGDSSWFAPDAMRAMVAPRAGGSHRLGWDGKSDENSSAGALTSHATFGHLGFTGTSLWCDPEARVAIALITNRVHPTRENAGIRALRPRVHDALMEALV